MRAKTNISGVLSSPSLCVKRLGNIECVNEEATI
jgi:hypothetical protein